MSGLLLQPGISQKVFNPIFISHFSYKILRGNEQNYNFKQDDAYPDSGHRRQHSLTTARKKLHNNINQLIS